MKWQYAADCGILVDVDSLIAQAVALADAGRRDEALTLLRAITRSAPNLTLAWKWLAFYTSDSREALYAVGQILQLDPDDIWARQAWQALIRQPQRRQVRPAAWLLLALALLAFVGVVLVETRVQQALSMAHDSSGQIVAGAAALPAPSEQVTVNIQEAYYPVVGDSVAAIRRSLSSTGLPLPGSDHRAIATTSYEIIVNWSVARANGSCFLEAVAVQLDLVYTYPHWEPPPGAPPELEPMWSSFMARVVVHEEYHGAIAQQCAHDVVEIVSALPAQPTCEDMEAAIYRALDDQHRQCEAWQRQFDAEAPGEQFP